MLDSVLKHPIKPFVSISFENKELEDKYRNEILIKYQQQVIFLCYNDKNTQFEHLRHIFYCASFSNNSKILFIDDDDLLLRLPDFTNFKCIRGYHYVPENDNNASDLSLDDVNKADKSNWMKYVEFSGYWCNYSLVKEYFLNEKYVGVPCLEDTNFMNYLDEYSKNNEIEPFIFHRLWYVEGARTWKNDLNDEIERIRKLQIEMEN